MSITPAARPRITRTSAVSRALKLAAPLPDEVYVIGLRGYYHDSASDNQRGVYDDCMCIVGPEHFSAYNANVDPSVRRKGIATLLPGVYPYRPGKHGISRPGGGYPAFRPATKNEALPVTRDGQPGTSDGIAINIHRGATNSTSSEGCQTIPPAQWDAFHATLTDQLKRAGQKGFRYFLVG